MMGIIGGAIIPLILGFVSDNLGQEMGMAVLGVCILNHIPNSDGDGI